MRIPVDSATTALVVVDLQPDFRRGAAMPVGAGDAIVSSIAALLREGPRLGTSVLQDLARPVTTEGRERAFVDTEAAGVVFGSSNDLDGES